MDPQRTNYLRHQLNKSPSKAAYTFGKTERFPITHEAHYGRPTTQNMKSPPRPPKYGVISRGEPRNHQCGNTQNNYQGYPRSRSK